MNTRKYYLLRAFALAAMSAIATQSASGQADILLQLRSGSPAGDRMRVDSSSGLIMKGELGHGIIPATGSGYRLMWYPFKAAFRVGGVDGGSATRWDDANIGFYTWAGGSNTRASGNFSFAFGLNAEVESSAQAAISFGNATFVSGSYGFAAGSNGRCTAAYCVSMGNRANAAGQGAIALGYNVTADADYSVAIGYRASTSGRSGAIVLSDASTTDSLQASANNQFSVRSAGGIRLYTNPTMTTGVTVNAGGSSWNVVSDKNRKANFRALSGEDVLHRLRKVPVTSWNYIAEGTEVRHVGPMAQDWHAAFGLNTDNLTINMSDFDGVNLAAVKALEERTTAQAEEITSLRSEVAELKARQVEMEKKQAELLQLVETALKKKR
jgi:hypothetical protein